MSVQVSHLLAGIHQDGWHGYWQRGKQETAAKLNATKRESREQVTHGLVITH